MQKNIFIICVMCWLFSVAAQADSTWKNSYALNQSDEWYGSEEAVRIAENVLIYQRNSGGWPKNEEMHEVLTDQQKQAVIAKKGDLSCFDNGATTTEMRFLAKVYRKIPDSRYREAFNRGLNCILEAQSLCGSGWPQYWPRRGSTIGSSYSNFITFNDNLTVNILQLLRDIVKDSGDFSDITDSESRQMSQESYDKGLQCILDCQIRNDDGQLTVWCAQHDPVTLLPAVARNYEMPSFSGCESANILTFLMSIENPSEAVKQAVEGGVRWFEENAIQDKALERFINESGASDTRIVDAKGSRLWGRFVQIGGEIGRKTYDALFAYLDKYGSTRTYVVNEKVCKYNDADNARNSYDPSRADQPIFCPKSQDAGCAYRFAYNFNDTQPVADANGVMLPTSLNTYDRTSYSFIGTWGEKLVNAYKTWKKNVSDETPDTEQTIVYAVEENQTFASGTTIKRENITLTYGETGGEDFLQATRRPIDETFVYYTPGNGVNGDKAGGTFYTFHPLLDGTLTMYVRHNLPKPLFIEEDGVALPEYNGITFDDTHPAAYGITIRVKGGSAYKLYCQGSKLGFYGFVYERDLNTGISNTVLPAKPSDKRIFSISGQRLPALRRGINIIGGKKVAVQ